MFTIEDFYQTIFGSLSLYDGKIVGTISFLDIGNNQVALRKMFVDKEYRGAKYKTASLLLTNAIEWAREKSIKAVYLGTTPQFLAAHRFYEKNGFSSIDAKDLPENFPVLQVDKKFLQIFGWLAQMKFRWFGKRPAKYPISVLKYVNCV